MKLALAFALGALVIIGAVAWHRAHHDNALDLRGQNILDLKNVYGTK